MGLTAGENGNNRWIWEQKWNKTCLSLGAGMRMGTNIGNRMDRDWKRHFRSSLIQTDSAWPSFCR